MVAEGYKDTEIGVIPDEWYVVELGKNSLLMTNGFVGTATSFYTEEDNGVVYIQGFNVQNNSFRLTNIKKITPDFNQKNKKSILKQGDLLTVQTGHIGITAVVSKDLENSNCHALIITRLVKDKLNPYFVSYYINSAYGKKQVKTIQVGTTMLHINVKDYLKYKVPLPPLKEQEKIADILSTADDKIDAIAIQIDRAETLKKGLLQKLLSEGIGHSEFKDSELGKIPDSWGVVELNDICSKIIGGGTPNSKIEDYWNNGTIYWATVKDMDNTKYLSKTIDLITEKGLKSSSANLIPANNIIIATRMGLGRLFINTVDMAINQDLKALIIKDLYNKNFIFWSLVFKSELILSLGTGTTVKGIRLEELRSIDFAIPSFEEQKKIADILSTADEKLEVLRAKKEKYETLKKGLLQKLLTGEVRV